MDLLLIFVGDESFAEGMLSQKEIIEMERVLTVHEKKIRVNRIAFIELFAWPWMFSVEVGVIILDTIRHLEVTMDYSMDTNETTVDQ